MMSEFAHHWHEGERSSESVNDGGGSSQESGESGIPIEDILADIGAAHDLLRDMQRINEEIDQCRVSISYAQEKARDAQTCFDATRKTIAVANDALLALRARIQQELRIITGQSISPEQMEGHMAQVLHMMEYRASDIVACQTTKAAAQERADDALQALASPIIRASTEEMRLCSLSEALRHRWEEVVRRLRILPLGSMPATLSSADPRRYRQACEALHAAMENVGHEMADDQSTAHTIETIHRLLLEIAYIFKGCVRERDPLPVSIRWLIRKDMQEVLTIERKSFDYPRSEEELCSLLRQRHCIGMVCEDTEERIPGFMMYELHRDRIKLVDIAVDPEFRLRGIGTQMIEKLVQKLQMQRRTEVEIFVPGDNLPAQLFLRANDFRAISSSQEDGGSGDCYRMMYAFQGEEQEETKRHNRRRRMQR